MLRTQTEAMSAVLGGCNSLTVEPFDASFRKPDEFSERIARNQQLLLREEAYFGKVTDPSGGSYYIEKLTEMIAVKAWELFLRCEDEGGFFEALKKGFIQKTIKDLASKRLADIASRKEVLLGTNQYPQFEAKAPEYDITVDDEVEETDLLVEPLISAKGAEVFEKLRLAAASHSKPPLVFMLTAGNIAMRRARAQFACNFFACGGYRVADNQGFATVQEGVDAAIKSGAAIVVVCSSDEEYAAMVPEVFEKISGRATVVVAGNPECMDDLKAKGIEHFISVKSNVAETLMIFHSLTGIEI
jgi:methylmalonyl-CoA mutase